MRRTRSARSQEQHGGTRPQQPPWLGIGSNPIPIPNPNPNPNPSPNPNQFRNRITDEISAYFLHLHVDHYVSVTQLDNMRGLLRTCAMFTADFIEEELKLQGHPADEGAFRTVRGAFDAMPNATTMIEQRRRQP